MEALVWRGSTLRPPPERRARESPKRPRRAPDLNRPPLEFSEGARVAHPAPTPPPPLGGAPRLPPSRAATSSPESPGPHRAPLPPPQAAPSPVVRATSCSTPRTTAAGTSRRSGPTVGDVARLCARADPAVALRSKDPLAPRDRPFQIIRAPSPLGANPQTSPHPRPPSIRPRQTGALIPLAALSELVRRSQTVTSDTGQGTTTRARPMLPGGLVGHLDGPPVEWRSASQPGALRSGSGGATRNRRVHIKETYKLWTLIRERYHL